MTNSSSVDRDDSNSEILELESIVANAHQPLVNNNLVDEMAALSIDSRQKMRVPLVTQSIKIGSTGETFDVTAELDLLLKNIELATPHPPTANVLLHSKPDERCADLIPRSCANSREPSNTSGYSADGFLSEETSELDRATASRQASDFRTAATAIEIDGADTQHDQNIAAGSGSCQEHTRQQQSLAISETIAAIAAKEPETDTQLHRELSDIHQQIVAARAELQSLHQRNQSQVEAIDANATKVTRLKVRTQQLAQYTKDRVGKVQELIGTVEEIRAEIVTGLEKFGGDREIRSLLTELETTRHALVLAHDRLFTGQEAFYDSLHEIEARVTAQSIDAVQQLQQDRELIQQLSQTISTDRLQIAGMSVDLSIKYSQVHDLSTQITDMHAQITEKSQILHSRVTEIDRGFIELAESVRLEKDQFYELTAQTIDRTEAMQSQFTNIAKEFSLDREAIAVLQSELTAVREMLVCSTEQQLDYFDLQFYELMTNWSELSGYHKKQGGDTRKISTWLWGLSAVVGIVFVLLIYLLMRLK